MPIQYQYRDRYARCEVGCNHDLSAGVLVADLLASDGPNVTRWVHSEEDSAYILEPATTSDRSIAA